MTEPQTFHDGSLHLQDHFDTRRLADRIEERLMRSTIGDEERAFINFRAPRPSRLRVNGIASSDERDPLLAEYPRAQLVVRVRATEVFPNCSRHIHRMALVERSRFVPRAGRETPTPDWKRAEWAVDVLPAGDPATKETSDEHAS
jgi:hypothetical protein